MNAFSEDAFTWKYWVSFSYLKIRHILRYRSEGTYNHPVAKGSNYTKYFLKFIELASYTVIAKKRYIMSVLKKRSPVYFFSSSAVVSRQFLSPFSLSAIHILANVLVSLVRCSKKLTLNIR